MAVVVERTDMTISVTVCGKGQIAFHLKLGNSTLGVVLDTTEANHLAESLIAQAKQSTNPN